MTGPLEGRVAIVTGAGRGIGRAIAAELVAAGASVVIADNGTSAGGQSADPSVAREAAATLGARVIAFTESVASPGAALALVGLATRAFGGLDIVVNNAAIRRDAPVFEAEPRDWDAVIRNNLSAPFYLTRAAAAAMRAPGKSGRIVNIVPSSGLSGGTGQAADTSVGAGLLGLTRVTALDLAASGITANAVVPLHDEEERPAHPGDGSVARLVTALCLPAAGGVTGQSLGVRGHEAFLLGQPRTAMRLEAAAGSDVGALAQALAAALSAADA